MTERKLELTFEPTNGGLLGLRLQDGEVEITEAGGPAIAYGLTLEDVVELGSLCQEMARFMLDGKDPAKAMLAGVTDAAEVTVGK